MRTTTIALLFSLLFTNSFANESLLNMCFLFTDKTQLEVRFDLELLDTRDDEFTKLMDYIKTNFMVESTIDYANSVGLFVGLNDSYLPSTKETQTLKKLIQEYPASTAHCTITL